MEVYWYFGAIGILIALAGVWQFIIAKTTLDPAQPNKTKNLVSNGIYRVTRNPMYLGMVLVLISAILKLGSLIGFITVPLFIMYITYFQVKPEERIMEGLFGDEYLSYKIKVRRWI